MKQNQWIVADNQLTKKSLDECKIHIKYNYDVDQKKALDGKYITHDVDGETVSFVTIRYEKGKLKYGRNTKYE